MSTSFYGINITGRVSGPGIKERFPVQTISLVNQNLATNLVGTSISGYTLVAGDRFILAGQTTGSQNGIYIAATTSYRAEDYESGDTSQSFVTVLSGTYANSIWQATANGVVGTSTQGFALTKYTVYTTGTIEYANSNNTRALLPPPSTSTSLLQMTTGGAPSWITTVPVANGGTGSSSLTAGNILLGNGTSPVNLLAPTAYKMLVSNGTPSFALSNNSYLTNISGSTYAGNIVTLTDQSTVTTTAANYFTIANALTTNTPTIGVAGTDTNVSLNLQAQGTGAFNFLSTATSSGTINLYQRAGTNYVGLQSPVTLPSSLTFVLPASYGTAGQFLTTNGSGVLSFTNAPTNLTNESLLAQPVIVSNMTQQTIAYFAYVVARYGSGAPCNLYFESVYSTAFNVIITNATTSTVISTTTISSSGFQTISFTAPTSNARLTFDVIKNVTGTSSQIISLQLSIN